MSWLQPSGVAPLCLGNMQKKKLFCRAKEEKEKEGQRFKGIFAALLTRPSFFSHGRCCQQQVFLESLHCLFILQDGKSWRIKATRSKISRQSKLVPYLKKHKDPLVGKCWVVHWNENVTISMKMAQFHPKDRPHSHMTLSIVAKRYWQTCAELIVPRVFFRSGTFDWIPRRESVAAADVRL